MALFASQASNLTATCNELSGMAEHSRIVTGSICDSRILPVTIRGCFYGSRITDNKSAEQTGTVGLADQGVLHRLCDNSLNLPNNADPYGQSSLTLSKDHLCWYIVILCMLP